MTIPARDGDRCPVCGTPLESVELSALPEGDPGDLVLRCANGHEQRVHRNLPDPEDGEAQDLVP